MFQSKNIAVDAIGFKSGVSGFIGSNSTVVGGFSGTTSGNSGQGSEDEHKNQRGNFGNRCPELSIRYLDQFFGCFRHAPLLTQIGFFGSFGLVAGALIISGIGAALWLLGSGSRRTRWIGAAGVVAGLFVWIAAYGTAW